MNFKVSPEWIKYAAKLEEECDDITVGSHYSFEQVMKKNAELKEKLEKERLKDNVEVLKSYKIKP